MIVRSSDDGKGNIMSLSDAINMAEDTFQPTTEGTDMTAKKKEAKAEPKAKDKKADAKPAAKEAKGKKELPEGFGPRAVPDGHTGLAAICEEMKLKPTVARRKLRAAEVEKPEGQHGWYWKDGSKDLKKIREILTAKEEAAE